MKRLSEYTDEYESLFKEISVNKGLTIAAGSHIIEKHGRYFNTAFLFTPEGRSYQQPKCHLFPPEKAWTTPGDNIHVIQMPKCRIALLVCYDMEFPEAARLAAFGGAEILASPSATLDILGYWRVRHCAQARCIENQVYAVHSSLLGEAAGYTFTGRAAVFTPCDRGFPETGVAAQTPLNGEGVVTAVVDLEMLHENRRSGAAPTLGDLRRDMIEALHRVFCTDGKGDE